MLGHRSLTFDDYARILKRRWALIVLPIVLLPLIGYGISYLIKPQYVSQTLVLISQPKVPDNYVKPVVTGDLDQRLASMKEQILSRSRLEPIIQQFNLSPGKNMDDRVDAVRKDIGITPIHSEIDHAGGLPGFFISFKANDPHTAQQVCAEITTLFVNQSLRDTEQSAQGTTSFLESQLAEAKANLDTQDQKLAQFQKTYLGRLPGESDENMGMLASLNTQLNAVTQNLARQEQDKTYQEAMLQQQLQQWHAERGNSPVGMDPRQQELSDLQKQKSELLTIYTANYPDVIAVNQKISDLKADLAKNPPVYPAGTNGPEPQTVAQLRAALKATNSGINSKRMEQMRLQSQIRTYQDRISSSPLVEEQYKELTRGYQEAQKFYDDLQAKMNQSKMATELQQRQQGEQFQVMDEPNLPDSPSFPKRWVFLLAGLFFGAVLGFGLAGWVEYRDTSIRSEQDIYAFLHLPTLAVLSVAGDQPLPKPAPEPKTRRSWFGRKLAADAS